MAEIAGDPRLHVLLDEIGELHDLKQKDYGTDNDPFANVRASELWGIPAWVGAMIRLNDKVKRLQALALRGEVANEDPEDSFKDIAVYALIACILYLEAQDDIFEGDDSSVPGSVVPVRLSES